MRPSIIAARFPLQHFFSVAMELESDTRTASQVFFSFICYYDRVCLEW